MSELPCLYPYVPKKKAKVIHDKYTTEDIKEFETACKEVGLNSLCQFLEKSRYNPYSVYTYIHGVSRKSSSYVQQEITDSMAEFHKELLRIMFIVPYRNLPLEVNQDKLMLPFVKWRLKIKK